MQAEPNPLVIRHQHRTTEPHHYLHIGNYPLPRTGLQVLTHEKPGPNLLRNIIAFYDGAFAPITHGASSLIDFVRHTDISHRGIVTITNRAQHPDPAFFPSPSDPYPSHMGPRPTSLHPSLNIDQGASAPITCIWCPTTKSVDHRLDSPVESIRFSIRRARKH